MVGWSGSMEHIVRRSDNLLFYRFSAKWSEQDWVSNIKKDVGGCFEGDILNRFKLLPMWVGDEGTQCCPAYVRIVAMYICTITFLDLRDKAFLFRLVLLVILFICWEIFSLLSIFTPRYFTVLLHFIFWAFIDRSLVSVGCVSPKKENSHGFFRVDCDSLIFKPFHSFA